MLLPKIVYNSTTLNFTYPPIQKPGGDEKVATRTDTVSSGGLLQSICERVETFRTLQMDFVPNTDMVNWEAFIDWAIPGNVFTYYPDATDAGTHDDWTLADTDFNPSYNFRSMSKFKIKMRKVITL